jgi:hypothetical protein
MKSKVEGVRMNWGHVNDLSDVNKKMARERDLETEMQVRGYIVYCDVCTASRDLMRQYFQFHARCKKQIV